MKKYSIWKNGAIVKDYNTLAAATKCYDTMLANLKNGEQIALADNETTEFLREDSKAFIY